MATATERMERRSRAGVAIVLVLGIVAIGMVLSFALLQSQTTDLQLQRNNRLAAEARDAATAGMAAALRKMHEVAWAGVATTLSGTLSETTGYTVTYTAGDSSLAPGDPNYADLPFRVTVLARGYAQDSTGSLVSTHQIRSVVRLVEKKMGTEPANWSVPNQFTVYLNDTNDLKVNVPCRIEGPIRAQGAVKVCDDYSWDEDTRERYMTDLYTMYDEGQPDYRPFNGPIAMPLIATDPVVRTLLEDHMGVDINDAAVVAEVVIPYPTSLAKYRLYAGGPEYAVPQLGSTLANVSLTADPATNPLGLFFRLGPVTIGDNVTIQGAFVCDGTVTIAGKNVAFKPVDLPALVGDSRVVRLPTAVVKGIFQVNDGASASVQGQLTVGQTLRVKRGAVATAFGLQGRLIADGVEFLGRTQWIAADMGGLLADYLLERLLGILTSSNLYFPSWLASYNLQPAPTLTIQPGSTPFTAHWQDPATPFYVPATGDAGLMWTLLEWKDLP